MNNIILIGYMGSGKTTVGKSLARLAGFTFVDTDEMIVENEQRTINEIFAEDGEEAFRNMETALIKKMISDDMKNLVISTGGGMPIRFENRELLRQLGDVVYLKASSATIYDRVKDDTTRPLLQCNNPKMKISDMLHQRGPLYVECASIIVNVDNSTQQEIAQEILRKVISI
jgi:shikimate kinase